jgi:glycine cleavage system H protein
VTATDRPLRYSFAHAWARAEDDGTVTVGITAFAQHELGELQYAGLPRIGSTIVKDASFGELESAKTVSDLYAPCSGSVVAANARVIEDPAIINRDPYGEGWMISVQPSAPAELDALVDEATYDAHVATQTH